MEIVQTCTGTWPWCMSMFGARFAVFVRRARVLPTPCPATRNLLVLEVSPAPASCCFNLFSTGLVRFDSIRELNIYCINAYGYVTPGLWCMLCSVYAKGAYCFLPLSFLFALLFPLKVLRFVTDSTNSKSSNTFRLCLVCACGSSSNRFDLQRHTQPTERNSPTLCLGSFCVLVLVDIPIGLDLEQRHTQQTTKRNNPTLCMEQDDFSIYESNHIFVSPLCLYNDRSRVPVLLFNPLCNHFHHSIDQWCPRHDFRSTPHLQSVFKNERRNIMPQFHRTAIGKSTNNRP